MGDIGRAGGARGADRLDPVVARRLRGEAGVRIGRHDLAVFHRVVAGLERREGVLGAVGRDLDQVALDPRANFARRDPGEVDLRGGVALHGVVRRRGEPGRRAGEDGVNVRVVVRLHGVARGVVAVNVLDRPRVVAVRGIGVGHRDHLPPLDRGGEGAQANHKDLYRHIADRDRDAVGDHREGARQGLGCISRIERLVVPNGNINAVEVHEWRSRFGRRLEVLGGGVVDVRGRAGAAGVDREDPVVAGRLQGEAGVAVGDVRGAGVLDQLLPVRGSVGRPLDAVAGRRRNPLDRRRRGPGEVDLRGGVALHRVVRRRREPRRRAGEGGVVKPRAVARRQGEARGVVAVDVLDRPRIVARGGVGVGDRDRLPPLDRGGEGAQENPMNPPQASYLDRI